MSNVTLSIGGRNFTVACAAGEQDHIIGLGRLIDTKLSAMGDVSGQSESRTLLFAALLLADELHDSKSASPAAATPELAPDSAAEPVPAPPAIPPQAAERLEAIALRLENLATALEG